MRTTSLPLTSSPTPVWTTWAMLAGSCSFYSQNASSRVCSAQETGTGLQKLGVFFFQFALKNTKSLVGFFKLMLKNTSSRVFLRCCPSFLRCYQNKSSKHIKQSSRGPFPGFPSRMRRSGDRNSETSHKNWA